MSVQESRSVAARPPYSSRFVATVVASYVKQPMPWTSMSRSFGASDSIIRHWCLTFGADIDTPPDIPFDELVAVIIKAVDEKRNTRGKAQAARKRAQARRKEADMEAMLAEYGVDVELLKSIPKAVEGGDIFAAPDKKRLTRDPEKLYEIVRQQQLMQAVLAERQKLLEEKITRLGKDHAPIRGAKDLTRIALAVIARGFTVAETLRILGVASSTFYYTRCRLDPPGRARRAHLAVLIMDICEEENYRVGYRVVHAILKHMGQQVSEKIVREIMATHDLSPRIKRRRCYSSYKGETDPGVVNRLHVADPDSRQAHEDIIALSTQYQQSLDKNGNPRLTHDFHADHPNQKWATDISEIPCKDGKLYLSPVIDLHDMYPVSVMIGNRPSMNLVTEMIHDAIDQLQPDQHPIIHSHRGFHYRAKAWFHAITTNNSDHPTTNNNYRLIPSMSRKATSGDNAAMEGFFGVLKREAFYYHDINTRELTRDHVTALLDEYITWYVNQRRFKRLGYQTLASHRGHTPTPSPTAT